MNSSTKVRAFVSIEFPDEVVKEVARVEEILGKKQFTGKLTELENLHLTLKFFGEIEESKLNEIRKRLRKIEFGKFEANLQRIGTLGKRGNVRIVWIKVAGKEIFDLQKKIDASLNGLFKVEESFTSHLTVARIKYVKDPKDFINYVNSIGLKKVKFSIKSFKLKSSELKPLGPIYGDIELFDAK